MGKGFPKMLQFTHNYVETITLSTTSGLTQHYRWSCNGMYDPNTTGGGHQPYYYDQLIPLYDHYTVIGSKCSIKVYPVFNQSVGVACDFGAFINDDNTTITTDPDYLAEYQTTKSRVLLQTTARPTLLTLKWSARKYFGKGVLANVDLQGTATSNPNEQSYYNIYVTPADNTSVVTFQVQVKIQYIAVWKELKEVPQS